MAVNGARLYFAVQTLAALDPMYQFSMAWFRELFRESLALQEDEVRERDPTARGCVLIQRFRGLLFDNVSMGLFGHHQLAFAFLMAVKVHESAVGPLAFCEEAEALRAKLQELDLGSQQRPGGRRATGAASTSKRSDTASQKGSERHSDRHLAALAQQAALSLSTLQEEDKLAVAPA